VNEEKHFKCTLRFAPLAKHYSGDKIKWEVMGGHVARMGI